MPAHRSRFRLAAAFAALALAVAAAPLGAGAAAAATVPFGSGSLDWGIKASFRDYLASPGTGGVITPADGATANSDGTFHFPLGTAGYDTATHAVTSAFGGSLHITAHNGQLDIKLADLAVSTSGTTGTLSADTTAKQTDGTTFQAEAVPLLTFPVAMDSFGGNPIAATLTAQGAKAFGGFYPAGSAMDPVRVALAQGPASGSGPAPDSGSPSPQGAAASSGSGSGSGSGSASASNSGAPSSKAEASVATHGSSGSSALPIGLGIAAVIVVAAGGGAVVLRRRRARRDG